MVARSVGLGSDQSRHVRQPSESELKQWLARELHDTVSATLTTMLIQMEQLKRLENEPGRHTGLERDVRTELDDLQDATRHALADLRRLVHELREEPCVVSCFVDSLREMVERFERGTGITSRFTAADGWPRQLGASAARNLVRIAHEALQNVRSHSAARSVEVSLECSGGVAIMTISDDGIGLESTPLSGAAFGLIGMRERAALVGGELHLQGAPGRGTTVQALIPVEKLL
jgi:two-component system sensor histidine kinase UhpB